MTADGGERVLEAVDTSPRRLAVRHAIYRMSDRSVRAILLTSIAIPIRQSF